MATAPAVTSRRNAKMRANLETGTARNPNLAIAGLRNRECPDFTVARPCGEQLDGYGARYGARYGAWIDLTGKISTPSLLKKVPDLGS